MTANIFTTLVEEIERCANAWLTPARQAIIAGMVGELIEARTEMRSDEALGFHLAKEVSRRFDLRLPVALLLAGNVLDNLMANASPILQPQDQQLEQAMRDVTKVPDLASKAPPIPAELAAKPVSILAAMPVITPKAPHK
jgi:hypothetical protein